ncbi:LolA family protein [Desulfocurvibacter africanus]|uniref:Outer membrane lipoprotein carrier protein LolA n=1 Tax=Desulfocurvibacter africanus subsp. africanus str. Walvis Bay TaxID=690850 RepID=F3YZB9_DESAF|nr:outer membrane lipoprotein carrier protein LolA [Desulfocurvibacter africanus]EGJ51948.1 outer membrane lipoprotein carrier protein LolA [Desulfocurvibacter africanus subsp. africanus str. Walvis Bay]
MRARILFTLAFLLLWVAPVSPSDNEAVLDGLRKAAKDIHSVSADFVQRKKLEMFDEVMISKGRLALVKPDRLRWEYLEPVASGFALKGGKGRRWNEMIGRMDDFDIRQDPVMQVIVDQLLAWTNADLERMSRDFTLEVAGSEPVQLVLRPRVPAVGGFIERIAIRYAADKRSIQRVEVMEPGGDSTQLDFQDVRINTPLAEDLF